MKAALLALALRVWCSTPSSWWRKSAPKKAAVQPTDTLTDAAHCGAAPADQAPAGEQLSLLSGTHIWSLTHCDATNRGRWFVSGLGQFTRSGFAVVNDYGDLVEVPR